MALQQISFPFEGDEPAPAQPGETPSAAEVGPQGAAAPEDPQGAAAKEAPQGAAAKEALQGAAAPEDPREEGAVPAAEVTEPVVKMPELFPPEKVAAGETVEETAPVGEPVAEAAPVAPAPPRVSSKGELFIWDPLPAAEAPAPKPARAAAGKGTREGRTDGRGRKSVKELAAAADLIDIPEDEVLFQKQYYAIGEVAAMFKVNTSLIRYWESEFSDIKPRKNKKGDRFFTPADVKTLELIHFLLRRKKLTIEGAKEYLRAGSQDGTAKLELVRSLEKIKAFLLELKARL